MSNARLSVQNDVMNCFRMRGIETGRTLTISELNEVYPTINHRTIRRAVEDLVKLGQLYKVGRKGKADLFGTSTAVKMAGVGSAITYHLGGELVDLPTLLTRVLSTKDNAFMYGHTRLPVYREGLDSSIRKAVATAVVTAGVSERTVEALAAKAALGQVRDELKDLLRFITGLEASAIFNVTQRDMVESDVKELIKNHPNLYTFIKDVAS